MSTRSSTPAVSSDVAELKGHGFGPLIRDRKNPKPDLRPCKAVIKVCVPCGSEGFLSNVQPLISNIYLDNLQEYRVPCRCGQFQPSLFLGFRTSDGLKSYLTSWETILNQGQIYRPPVNSTGSSSRTGSSAQRTSSSVSGTLHGFTVTNPKEDLKGSITRSGVSIQGPKKVNQTPRPRVPLILGRCFLKTSRALIDVYEGEITLRVGKEAITFNLDQTSRYTANFNHMTANRIDVIDMASEEYSQEVLGFSDSVAYGNPSPCFDPIVANSSPTLTPFGESDFLLFEEANAFCRDDVQLSPEVDPNYYDPDGDFYPRSILVELKDLPPHLEYAFLEDDNKLPVIIAKELSLGEKADLIKILKDFSKYPDQWTHILEKNTPFIFSNECIQAFQTLKNKLTEAPILIAPNWDLPFELMCDASDYAIGAVLGQRHEKHFRPIHYASKTMTEAESNYTTRKEMLAVVYAFEKIPVLIYHETNECDLRPFALFKYLFA
ncbi:reverse transcriptase domain-containing protein [Tanacetum coccineum]|uniref:Reverse transcriptase domain-containing protein n=1 Tax=Tanacetum coccineum TaxID=301880 RepID=A0ABQ5GRY4_9ASTR